MPIRCRVWCGALNRAARTSGDCAPPTVGRQFKSEADADAFICYLRLTIRTIVLFVNSIMAYSCLFCAGGGRTGRTEEDQSGNEDHAKNAEKGVFKTFRLLPRPRLAPHASARTKPKPVRDSSASPQLRPGRDNPKIVWRFNARGGFGKAKVPQGRLKTGPIPQGWHEFQPSRTSRPAPRSNPTLHRSNPSSALPHAPRPKPRASTQDCAARRQAETASGRRQQNMTLPLTDPNGP